MKILVIGTVGLALVALLVIRGSGDLAGEEKTMPDQSQTAKEKESDSYSQSGYKVTRLGQDRIKQLSAKLPPKERHILLEEGTERPFTGALLENKKEGLYTCRLCGLPLFRSDTKFESGTGWPSFFKPFDPAHIHEERDEKLGRVRVEIECGRCRAHLGHVFKDGPEPTGLRYCTNSASLAFHENGTELPPESQPATTETAYFAGGCFWGIEDRFQQVPGVVNAVSGYQGGHVDDPDYKQVCHGDTGHAESVRVSFDPQRVTYQKLLEWFFTWHDPTQLNRQGPDVGTQYRSAIFAATDKQLTQAKSHLAQLEQSERFRGRKIVTQIQKADPFYKAEEYHQDYHAKHGGSCSIPASP